MQIIIESGSWIESQKPKMKQIISRFPPSHLRRLSKLDFSKRETI